MHIEYQKLALISASDTYSCRLRSDDFPMPELRFELSFSHYIMQIMKIDFKEAMRIQVEDHWQGLVRSALRHATEAAILSGDFSVAERIPPKCPKNIELREVKLVNL